MAMGWMGLAGAALALGLCGAGVIVWRKWRRPLSAAERERRRRRRIQAEGRVCDGVLVEFRDPVIYYRYHVGGSEYVASQDLSGLLDRLPAQLAGLTGHVSVKYLPANPANSIVVSEDWCGLHRATSPTGRAGDTPAPTRPE